MKENGKAEERAVEGMIKTTAKKAERDGKKIKRKVWSGREGKGTEG